MGTDDAKSGIRQIIIQAEKFLNADWLKRSSCIYFKYLPYLGESSYQVFDCEFYLKDPKTEKRKYIYLTKRKSILKFEFLAILLLKIAQSTNFRRSYLLRRVYIFQIFFFNFEILVRSSFNWYH